MRDSKSSSGHGTPRLGRLRLGVWLACAGCAVSALLLSAYMDVRSRATPDAWGVADEKKVDFYSIAGKTVFSVAPWPARYSRSPHWQWYNGRPPILHERIIFQK